MKQPQYPAKQQVWWAPQPNSRICRKNKPFAFSGNGTTNSRLFIVSPGSSSSSICGAGGNPTYRTSVFEAICTVTPILFYPFIFRGAPCQTMWETSISERRNSGLEMAGQIHLRAANLRHGTDGWTSPPKEGMLRIFWPEKSDGFGRVWNRSVSRLLKAIPFGST
jgi:hypothetical protein